MNPEATPLTPSSTVRQPSLRLSRRQWLGLLPALTVLPQVACAASPPPAWPAAALELVDRDSGQTLTVYRQGGRSYVAGRPGARYALRLRNLAPRRVLMVLSVDGVNVVSGQTAALSQTGYVLEPGQTSDITGWRKSDSEVAAFEFAALEDSYAARTGRPDHVGVIGLAAFVEKAPEPPPLPAPAVSERSDGPARPAAAPASPMAKSAEATGALADARARHESRLGTGHGARESSVVQRTHFERASSTPDQVLRIDYDRYERLLAAGIVPRPYPPERPGRPSPFPAQPQGYVPDPPPRS